jgi:hypothetical protein
MRLVEAVTQDTEFLPGVFGKFQVSYNFNIDNLKREIAEGTPMLVKESMLWQSYSRPFGHANAAFSATRFVRENHLLDTLSFRPSAVGTFYPFHQSGLSVPVNKSLTHLFLCYGTKAEREAFVIVDSNHKVYSIDSSPFDYAKYAIDSMFADASRLYATKETSIKEVSLKSFFSRISNNQLSFEVSNKIPKLVAKIDDVSVEVVVHDHLKDSQIDYTSLMAALFKGLIDTFGYPDDADVYAIRAMGYASEKSSKSFLAQALFAQSSSVALDSSILEMDYSGLEVSVVTRQAANQDLIQFLS